MARYKPYDYIQTRLIPVSLEHQLLSGTLEHAIHEVVEQKLDLSLFDAHYQNDATGGRAYDPKILLKVILCAYARGIVGSRRIEWLCRNNVTCMALACMQCPDHSTIAAFVSSRHAEILTLFGEVLLVCEAQQLLGGTVFALDGLKLSSKASKEWRGPLEELRHKQAKLDAKIAQVLAEHQQVDAQGSLDEELEVGLPAVAETDRERQGAASVVRDKHAGGSPEDERVEEEVSPAGSPGKGAPAAASAPADGRSPMGPRRRSGGGPKRSGKTMASSRQQRRQQKRARRLKRLRHQAERLKSWLASHTPRIGRQGKEIQSNVTDPESAKMPTSHGVVQGYNAQALVDDAYQVIVAAEVVGDGQDAQPLTRLLTRAKATMQGIGHGALLRLNAREHQVRHRVYRYYAAEEQDCQACPFRATCLSQTRTRCKHLGIPVEDPPTIPLTPLRRINLLDHLLTAALGFRHRVLDRNAEILLFGRFLGQTCRPERAGLAILLIRYRAAVRPMTDAMFAGFQPQDLPIGAAVALHGLIIGDILVPQSLFFLLLCLLRLIAVLVRNLWITLAEVVIRDVGVEMLLVTGRQIPITDIAAVGQPGGLVKAILTMSQSLHRGLRARHDLSQILRILSVPKRLRNDDDLVRVVDQCLSIGPLNHAMGGRHPGRVIVDHRALDFCPPAADVLVMGRQPFLKPSDMPTIPCLPLSPLVFQRLLGSRLLPLMSRLGPGRRVCRPLGDWSLAFLGLTRVTLVVLTRVLRADDRWLGRWGRRARVGQLLLTRRLLRGAGGSFWALICRGGCPKAPLSLLGIHLLVVVQELREVGFQFLRCVL